MDKRLFHPKLLDSLGSFFNSTCTIQEYTETQDEWGEPIQTWADKPGHIDIPCAIAPSGGQEVKRPDMTYVVSSHYITLRGNYPAITEAMRAVVAGKTYDILLVEHDSRGITTRLSVQVVT